MSYALPFLRILPQHPVEVLLCSDIAWLGTHFVGRRLLCSGAGCPACPFDEPRTFCYALARSLGSGVLHLLEVPAPTFGCVQQTFLGASGALGRGCTISLARKHRKAPIFADWTNSGAEILVAESLTLGRAILASFGCGSCPESLSVIEALQSAKARLVRRLADAVRKAGYGDFLLS